ncbi:MAG: hypothetical protein GF329_08785 [Candidatus Lokiarchaeota archaeon]|nr:hypothetical protein [Candidatus Lokiarchaeota archaeon]
MSKKISRVLIDFFERNPHLKPSKMGHLGMKVGEKSYLLKYRDRRLEIKETKRENIKSVIFHISKRSFYKLFSSKSIEEFNENLIRVVLMDKNVYLETVNQSNPMKNVFFKILSINRGKMGMNRYELMVPII